MDSPMNAYNEKGFTLIEVMITLVISLVVLGGLMLNFSAQNSEYKYQNNRVDVVQDAEFFINFMAEDLRSALISEDLYANPGAATPVVTIVNSGPAGTSGTPTTSLRFEVWDPDAPSVGADNRATRVYTNNGSNISYARNIGAPTSILQNVSFFKVFDDSQTTGENDRSPFTGLPSGLPSKTLNRVSSGTVNVPGYTILLRVRVPGSSRVVTRYVQVHPLTTVQ